MQKRSTTPCLFLSALFSPQHSSLWHTKQTDNEDTKRLKVLQVCGISKGKLMQTGVSVDELTLILVNEVHLFLNIFN